MSEEFNFFLNAAFSLFVILDPFAVVPVYLILTERFTDQERKSIRHKASIVAAGILLTFALTGLGLFNLFGITLPAFQIAGGILMLLLGIAQLNARDLRVKKEETQEGLEKEDVSIFPLATPLIAGPGAISTTVLYTAQADTFVRRLNLLLVVIFVVSASHVVLKLAPRLFKVLGQTGLNLLTRIMGIILTAIAIQFIINGIRGTLEILKLIPVS